MAGRPGRSGGHNRVPIEERLLRGTFVPSKHAKFLPHPMSEDELPDAWEPTADELAALGASGRKFLTAMVEQNACTLVQGTLLLQAAHVLDALQVWRQEASTNPRAARLALQHTSTFAGLLASVRTW